MFFELFKRFSSKKTAENKEFFLPMHAFKFLLQDYFFISFLLE